MLERLTQLVKQPRVLYGDDGLRGEICDQLDLLVGEGVDSSPANHDDADDGVLPDHRDREDRPMHLLRSAVILVREDIVNVHDAALQNGSSRRRSSILTDRIPLHDLDEFRRVAIAGRNAINLPILRVDEALVGVTESDRVLQQTLQHRLEFEC